MTPQRTTSDMQPSLRQGLILAHSLVLYAIGLLVVTLLIVAPTPAHAQAGQAPGNGTPANPQAANPAAQPAQPTYMPGFGGPQLLVPDTPPKATTVQELPEQPALDAMESPFALVGPDHHWAHYEVTGAPHIIGTEDEPISLPTTSPLLDMTKLVSASAKQILGATLWLVDWIFSLRIAGILTPLVSAMAEVMTIKVLGPIKLIDIAMIIAIGHVLWRVLTRQRARATSHVLTMALLVALSSVMLSHPLERACQSLGVLRAMTTAVLSFATTAQVDAPLLPVCAIDESQQAGDAPPPTSPEASQPAPSLLAPLADPLFTTMVQRPFMMMQWGPMTPPCEATALAIVERGAYGDSPEPRNVMRHQGCEVNATFNAGNYPQRLSISIIYAISVLAMSIGIALLGGLVAFAQVGGSMLILVAPVLMVLAIAPGAPRRWLQWWLLTGLKLGVVLLVSAGMLSLLLLALGPLMTWTTSVHPMVGALMVGVVVISVGSAPWILRYRTIQR